MGQDAGIFAKKSSKYYWFDRLSNIESYWDAKVDDPTLDKCYDIYTRLLNTNGASKEEVEYLINICEIGWDLREESVRYHIYALHAIRRFIKLYPNDEFFIVSDYNEKWPQICDIYQEVKVDLE